HPGEKCSQALGIERKEQPTGDEIVKCQQGPSDPACSRSEVSLDGGMPNPLLLTLVDAGHRNSYAVVRTPEHKIERLSMPHSAGDEVDVHADDGEQQWAFAEVVAIPQLPDNWPVHIVHQPRSERHVPVRP